MSFRLQDISALRGTLRAMGTQWPPTLHTARLTLRPFCSDDLDAHIGMFSDPEVTRYLPRGPFASAEVPAISRRVVDHFISHWHRHPFGTWAVVDTISGAFIGQAGLNMLQEAPEVEVLYALAKQWWGRGLASEAARAAVDFGFDEAGLERIVGLTLPGNLASQRVLAHAGLHYEKDATFFGLQVRYFALDRAGRTTNSH